MRNTESERGNLPVIAQPVNGEAEMPAQLAW